MADSIDDAVQLLLEEADGSGGEGSSSVAAASSRYSLSVFQPGKGFVDIASRDEEIGDREFMLTVLDLWSGTSSFAQTPGGRSALIDIGGASGYKHQVAPYLKEALAGRDGPGGGFIDDLIISAPYQELIDGMKGMLSGDDEALNLGEHVGTATMSDLQGYNRRMQHFQALLDAQGISRQSVRFPEYWKSDLEGKPRGPREKPMKLGLSDQSLVTRIRYGDFQAMLLGGAGDLVQRELMQMSPEELRSNVLVAPKGFVRDVDPRLVEMIDPDAIIESGSDRRTGGAYEPPEGMYQFTPDVGFDFPGGISGPEPTYENLLRETPGRYPVFSTDEHGRIEMFSSGRGWRLSAPTSERPLINISQSRYPQESPFNVPEYEPPPFASGSEVPSRQFKQIRERSDAWWRRMIWYPLRQAMGLGTHEVAIKEEPKRPPDGVYRVTAVEDADTISVAGLDQPIRLLGINAPEMNAGGDPQPYAEEAIRYVRDAIGGMNVYLEFDETTHDAYGRPLAYVFFGDTFINEEVLKAGYATKYVIGKNRRYSEIFTEAERAAKDGLRGIWSGIGNEERLRQLQSEGPFVSPERSRSRLKKDMSGVLGLGGRAQPLRRRRRMLEMELSQLAAMVSSDVGDLPQSVLSMYNEPEIEYPA